MELIRCIFLFHKPSISLICHFDQLPDYFPVIVFKLLRFLMLHTNVDT